ncbi:MAG: hypothetical protein EAZ99_03270, partial [Alphaproteobacteria bacterium]
MRSLLITALVALAAIPAPAFGQPAPIQASATLSARDAVAATAAAAAATLAAEQRRADQVIRGLRANIGRLENEVAAGRTSIAALTAAREALIQELASRDRQYAEEIRRFRDAVERIA